MSDRDRRTSYGVGPFRGCRVYVGDIGLIKRPELEREFGQYGPVIDVWMGSKRDVLCSSQMGGSDRSLSDTAHREKVNCMIRANQRVKQKEIADEVGILKERVHHIITTVLGYRKVSAYWVPRQLTVEMKVQRKDMCTQLLERYNAEGEAFLQRILTGDESWVNHYDPECKAQLMEYRHKTSLSLRKFKVAASARKVLFTFFWDMEGVVHMEFL
ncbi:histone-lysine N-methyltransferase SETMAR [Plakobranchus ocellatus]|uniref:Histone-lysine N-methyltransferase SETMAR n=1 Tax=Plakobranchus ocellatus TaxID=259542 RepID=A0AAV4A166_9GAST|nr:histone-lysine N-methyltransferase SETMAR [Plakobranchus ocellatus]